jgi:hypothetical protein
MTWRITIALVALVCIGCQHASPPSAQAHEDFPYLVRFEQGATKFANGDEIRITEVRGTSPDMRGGIYRITGTYKLVSRDKATLAASVTARRSQDGVGPWNPAQHIDVTKGSGTFTLLLPMSVDGWPHVSFYNGESFGGNYIGSGDTTLRKWWGS